MVELEDPLVVADTDLLIDFLRDRAPGADSVQGWMERDRLRIATVTAFELRIGADFLRRQGSILSLLVGRTLPLDVQAALRAGDVFWHLRSEGRSIGVNDSMIAGTCLRFELPLATRNVRHFERIPGLRLVEG